MSEYNMGFSVELIDAARFVADEGLDSVDAIRTVLYLSKLACEITLKALLEKAGKPIVQIKQCHHDLDKLLVDLSKCEVQEEVTKGSLSWVRAVRLRGEPVDEQYADATVGNILTSEERGASKYPSGIRYGNNFRDYPPELWLKTAAAIVKWAENHWEYIRV